MVDGMTDRTEGVETLLGDPKSAIRKMSLPIMVALGVQTAYNLFDAIWVAGLGADALAAIGISFPIYFTMVGFAHGLGAGVSSAISRRIGAQDREGSDSAAVNGLGIMLLFSVALSILLLLGYEAAFIAIGAEGEVLSLAMRYTFPYLVLSSIFFISNFFNYIIIAEGDTKMAMRAMMLSAGLNIVLDPIFIYTLDMGIAGAAYATLLSLIASSSLMAHRFLVRRDTFIRLHIRRVRFEPKVAFDILKVGIPASVQELALAISALFINAIILLVADSDGVAVYNTGWRVLSLGIVPLIGISMALTPISGAAFGSRRYADLLKAHSYAIRFGFAIELVVCGLLFVFADQVVTVFTWSDDSARLANDIALFLRVACFSCFAVTWGILSTSIFQGMGKGTFALAGSIIQFVLLGISIPFVLGVLLGLNEIGIWGGIVVADAIGSFILYVWVRAYVKACIEEKGHSAPSGKRSD